MLEADAAADQMPARHPRQPDGRPVPPSPPLAAALVPVAAGVVAAVAEGCHNVPG